jgi:hypothetical protein
MGVWKVKTTIIRWTLSQTDPHPPSSRPSKLGSQIISGAKRKRRRRTVDSINTLYYIHI